MKKQDLSTVKLPDHIGVYFFHDKDGRILYIGKATTIRDRVRSYFNPDLIKTRGLRLVSMVNIAHKVTCQETDSIFEALLLESSLIKKHNPLYNVKEKDDKSFTCMVITKEEYPRVLPMRIRDFEKKFNKKDVLAVYGPFASLKQLRDILKITRKLFPYRDTCIPMLRQDLCINTRKDLVQNLVQKKCFNAQIGLCPGVCVGAISQKDYKKNIANIRKLFSGKKKDIKKSLEKEMKSLAKKEDFEKAGQIRNTLFALDHINDVNLITDEKIISFKSKDFRIEAYDVAHISGMSRVGAMSVIEGGEKETSEYRKFKLTEKVNDDYAGLKEILSRRLKHTSWRLPDLFVFDGGVGQKQVGEKILAEAGILVPCVSVVKDDKHKPKNILGDKVLVENYKKAILLANHEAHRFAISYHRQLRNKLN